MTARLLFLAACAASLLTTAAMAQQDTKGWGSATQTSPNADVTGTINPRPAVPKADTQGNGVQSQSGMNCKSESAKMTNGTSESCK